MAVTILTIDDKHFSIDGVTYQTNFQSTVPNNGDLVQISNVYDSKDIRVKKTIF